MRNLRKYLAVLLAVAMMLTAVVPAIAAGEAMYSQEAEDLHELGLLKGVDANTFNPALDQEVDRQSSIVLMMRMFGMGAESKADQDPTPEARAALAAKFTDADQIADWAVNAVAYAVEKGYVGGNPDGTFRPTDKLVGRAYSKLVLSMLGYVQDADFSYDKAGEFFTDVAYADEDANFNSATAIKRDTMVGISFWTLETAYKDSEETVIQKLVKDGVVEYAKADELGFWVEEPVAPTTAPSADPSAEPTTAPSADPSADPSAEPTTAPTSVPADVYGVVSVSPQNGDKDVSADTDILITFAKELDSTTVTNSSIIVKEKVSGTVAAGTASYTKANKQVKFDITGALKNSIEYVVTVSDSIKDVDGNALKEKYTFEFTTSNTPVVQSQNPTSTTDWSSAVAQVVFNKAMDASTLTAGTVKLINVTDNVYIPGSVTVAADGKTVSFTADASNLEANKSYNIIIGKDVKDLMGVAVAEEIKVVFVRGTAPALVGGTSTKVADDSTAPYSSVYSKITASGGNASFRALVQFNVDMNADTINNSTITLRDTDADVDVDIDVTYDAGSRYVTIVPKADLKDETNYQIRFDEPNIKSAYGLVPAAIADISFDTGDFTKPTFVSSTPGQGDADVATDAQIKVVFSEALDNTLARLTNAATTLTTVANASNYNSNNAIYRLKNESTGNWVDMTSAVGGLNFSVSASSADKSLTFTPATRLDNNTTYSLYIRGDVSGATDNVRDAGLNELDEEVKVTFTTVALSQIAPKVVSIKQNGEDITDSYGVDNVYPIKITFDKAVQMPVAVSTVLDFVDRTGTADSFTVASNAAGITFEDAGKTVVIPTTLIPKLVSADGMGSEWRLTIQNVTDTETTPNVMVSKSITFYSGPRPTVEMYHTSTDPKPFENAVAVSKNPVVVVNSTVGVDTNSINTSTVKLVKVSDGSSVNVTITTGGNANSRTITLTHTSPLDANSQYKVVVDGVKDTAGNPVTAKEYVFTTVDTTAPTVESVTPADNTANVATDASIQIKFAQAMDVTTVISAVGNIELKTAVADTAVPFDLSYDTSTNTVTIDPTSFLAPNTAYKVYVGTNVTGNNGVAFAEQKTYSFGTSLTSVQGKITSVSWADTGTVGAAEANETVTIFFDVPLRNNQATAGGGADALLISDFVVSQGSFGAGATISYTAGDKFATITLGGAGISISNNATTVAPAFNSVFDANSTPFTTTSKVVTKN